MYINFIEFIQYQHWKQVQRHFRTTNHKTPPLRPLIHASYKPFKETRSVLHKRGAKCQHVSDDSVRHIVRAFFTVNESSHKLQSMSCKCFVEQCIRCDKDVYICVLVISIKSQTCSAVEHKDTTGYQVISETLIVYLIGDAKTVCLMSFHKIFID